MQHCIDEGILDDDSRSDITRTLVTLLVSKYGPKPGRVQCEELGRQLILKYPFMKDDLGNGYVSMYVFIGLVGMLLLCVGRNTINT